MGKDASVTALFADGPDEGRLQFEPPKLLFRGAQRREFDGDALEGLRVDGADMVLADGSRFTLGENEAPRWAEAILNPKARMDKIGVKPGMRVAIMGVVDPTLSEELAGCGAQPVLELSNLDILFYAADTASELARVGALVPMLSERGALWIVSHKGTNATVKDVEVMTAAKAHGLVDNKVVAFSSTLTSLRFVRRKVDASTDVAD